MVKSLAQLKAERDRLVGKNTKGQLSRQKALERKKLEAEINALKNPRVAAAKKGFLSASKRFGASIKRNAGRISDNITSFAQEEERRIKKRKVASKKRSKPMKRKTSKRKNSLTWRN